MTKSSPGTIEKYKQMLERDPFSKVFAALSDAYRELGMFSEAELTARDGIEKHPNYAGGYLALGRLLIDQQETGNAVPMLKKATELDAQNILAHQLLGQAYLQLKLPKEALRSFKMVLFLNPISEKAKAAIEKLESFTADEFDDDVFSLQPLKEGTKLAKLEQEWNDNVQKNVQKIVFAEAQEDPAEIDRSLSLIDALIVRNELEQAEELLQKLQKRFPDDPRYQGRWRLLTSDPMEEVAQPIKPIISREKQALNKKISLLEKINSHLQKIKTIDQA